MKKYVVLVFALLLFSFCLRGCGSETQGEKKISDYQWRLETISDLEGNILVTNSEQPKLADTQCDMRLYFNGDNTFLLSDKTNKQEWEGTYTLKKLDKLSTSYQLNLLFENIETEYIGVYGIRTYEDKTEIPSITFQTEHEILSFLASE